MIRVMTVLGTRPEAIKLAPVILRLMGDPRFEHQLVVTGQHRELLASALAVFGLTPDVDLKLMEVDQTPAEVAASVLRWMPAILESRQPNIVVVQGDTMTTVATAWAAYLATIPVAHVEAGLRTYQPEPFPEEMNRVLTSRLATYHFAPTITAFHALLDEGVKSTRIWNTGNTAVDALQWVLANHPARDRVDDATRTVLVTIHRRESFGAPLVNICLAIRELYHTVPDIEIVWPVHPNPTVRGTVHEMLSGYPGIRLVEPVDYIEFCHLMARSSLILTDSGGIQEEAPSLNVPVLVLRDVTERPEGVDAGCAQVVGTDPTTIVNTAVHTLAQSRTAPKDNPYGDGMASLRIVEALAEACA